MVGVVAIGIGIQNWVRASDYRAENVRIIEDLPAYPGSYPVAVHTTEYREGWLDLSTGYMSEATRSLHKGAVTNEQLADFYASRLGHEWKRISESGCDAFARGDTIIVIRRDVFDHSTIIIVVDARGKDRCREYDANLAS